MTLMALLIAGLYSLLHLAAEAHARIGSHLEQAEAERVTDRYLSRQLGRATRQAAARFRGSSRAMQFPVTDGAFGAPRVCRVYLHEGPAGVAVYTQMNGAPGAARPSPVVLLSGLRAASLAYFGAAPDAPAVWRDRWDAPERLPALVRLDYRDRAGARRAAYFLVGPGAGTGR